MGPGGGQGLEPRQALEAPPSKIGRNRLHNRALPKDRRTARETTSDNLTILLSPPEVVRYSDQRDALLVMKSVDPPPPPPHLPMKGGEQRWDPPEFMPNARM